MTGQYDKFRMQLLHGPDPLDDPLVAVWDAVVLGEPETPQGCDPFDTSVVRRFQALESIPLPSDAFFEDLERRLAHLTSQTVAEPSVLAAFATTWSDPRATPRQQRPQEGEERSGARPAPGRNSRFPGVGRGFLSMPVAAAVLVLLLIAGPLVFYLAHETPSEPPAIPAAVAPPPAMETMAQLDFTPSLWDLPAASTWDHMEFGLLTVAPRQTFTPMAAVSWYTAIAGPFMFQVLSGNLIFQPAGPALVYRRGSSAGMPVEYPAGESVTLGPNDAIVISTEAAATGTNPGSSPARILFGLAGMNTDATAFNTGPQSEVEVVDSDVTDLDNLAPGDGASIAIRHLRLAPLDTFVYEKDPDLHIQLVFVPLQINDLRIYDGALDDLAQTLGQHGAYVTRALLKFPDPGPHTLVNIGDEPVDLYFMVIEPYPGTATPVP